MYLGGRSRVSGSPRPAIWRLVLAALVLALAAGCAATHSPPRPTSQAVSCGMAKSPANVPIHIEVTKGHVACATALSVEHKYASDVRAGLAPGNGGGGPVKVNGWVCQSYATPVVLHTGKASECIQGTNEILAILPSTT
jgi:hypothetical protein